MGKKIFISHASVDKVLVDAFVRFLRMGLEIKGSDIFCTSLLGTLTTGASFIEQIKDNVINCEKVVFLITESYLKSPFCMSELGAAWAINQKIYPIIIPPVNFSDINATPLMGIQAVDLSRDNTLSLMANEFVENGIADAVNYSMVAEEEREFKSSLKKYLNFLKADANGFVVATVIDSKKFVVDGQDDYCGYKIKEKINRGQTRAEGEAHWILYRHVTNMRFTANDKIRFSLPEIREDTPPSGSNDRFFIASSVLGMNVEF